MGGEVLVSIPICDLQFGGGQRALLRMTCAVIQSKRSHKVLERVQKRCRKALMALPAL